MDIPKDKDDMTVQDHYTEIFELQNKSISSLIDVCKSLNERARVNIIEHSRLEKRIKSLESFAMGLFIANAMVTIVLLIILLVAL
jgi:hypothetical protein